MLNVFIIPRGLPERKKNFWPGGAELADLIKIKYGIQTCHLFASPPTLKLISDSLPHFGCFGRANMHDDAIYKEAPMRAGTTPNGQPRSTALYEAILRLDNLDDCIRFFEDLCAVTELRTMEQRYDVAGCLLQGKVYSEIRQLTGASSATVSRVNRMLNYGTGAVGKSVRHDLAAQQDGENSEGGTTE